MILLLGFYMGFFFIASCSGHSAVSDCIDRINLKVLHINQTAPNHVNTFFFLNVIGGAFLATQRRSSRLVICCSQCLNWSTTRSTTEEIIKAWGKRVQHTHTHRFAPRVSFSPWYLRALTFFWKEDILRCPFSPIPVSLQFSSQIETVMVGKIKYRLHECRRNTKVFPWSYTYNWWLEYVLFWDWRVFVLFSSFSIRIDV